MKKLVSIFLILFYFQNNAQIIKFNFLGDPGTCPTQNNVPVMQPLHLTISEVSRSSDIYCVTSRNYFTSTNFSQNLNFSDYIEVTISVETGYTFNITNIYFNGYSSNTNRVRNLRIAHNASGDFNTYKEFLNQDFINAGFPEGFPTTDKKFEWTNFAPTSISNGNSIKFRIYAWTNNTSNPNRSTGILKINNIQIDGMVTSINEPPALWATSTENNIINTNSGSVGIGTQSPNAESKLDVAGNIFTNGKVLIGTSDISRVGDFSLAVNGDAIFNRAVIRLYGSWPDYVFNNDYILDSLEDVEKFIKENKHLKGLMPASKIKDNGIDLLEIQKQLTLKIEELTLYIIEQNKKIKELNSLIHNLQ